MILPALGTRAIKSSALGEAPEMQPDELAYLTGLRHALHQRPETSGEEQGTAKRITRELAALAPDRLLTSIGGHGVAALFDGAAPGPTVAVRCELDALPIPEETCLSYASQVADKAHLCGHDGHMAMVLGVAQIFARCRPERGRVALIFQPAEETGKGAIAFRADPQFREIAPDYVFSLHNLPGLELGHVEICSGATNCASRGMRITLRGKTSHAAAPQDGVSPATALSQLIPALTALGQADQFDENYALTTVTHARLGEATFGVAPGVAELWVTLRTVTDARMTKLLRDAEKIVQSSAQAEGLDFDIAFDDVFEACNNDPEAVDMLSRSCERLGVPPSAQCDANAVFRRFRSVWKNCKICDVLAR